MAAALRARGPAGSAACGGCPSRRSCAVIRPRRGRKPQPAMRWAACRRLLMGRALAVRVRAPQAVVLPSHGHRLERRSWSCTVQGPSPARACVLIARTAVEGSSRCYWLDRCAPDVHRIVNRGKFSSFLISD